VAAVEPAITVVVEGGGRQDALVHSVPPGSTVVTATPDGGLASVGADGTPPPQSSTLAGLADIVRSSSCDVLFVSEPGLLTMSILADLRRSLALDSSCATASVEAQPRGVPGLPGPVIDEPLRGVVLARRSHLVLALDEAGLHADEPGSARTSGDLFRSVFATLVRPGFVHRAAGLPDGLTRNESATAPTGGRRLGSIVLDGRCLRYPLSGTQLFGLELLGALVRAGEDVAVLVPDEIHPSITPHLERLDGAVRQVRRSGVGRPEVFHRPFQIGSLEALTDCLEIGGRLVLTHLDMIVERASEYARSDHSWDRYRTTTAAALSSADEIGFLSRHTVVDAASDGLLDVDRATVVPLGVDHLRRQTDCDPARPLDGRPFMLVLGNAYWHKNRVFAIRLLEWLVEREDWDGGLVLAGGDPAIGSSRAAEAAVVARSSALAGRVLDLGHVTDDDRQSLYRGAELVLFPSLFEGFGLVPFEAAAMGRPCVYSHVAAMRELLPGAGALPSFDLEAAGPFVLDVLESPDVAARIVAAINGAAAGLTWERTAEGYLDVYARALAREPRGVSRLLLTSVPAQWWRMREQEALVLEVYRRRRGFRAAVDATIRAGAIARRAARRAHPPRN
jgi:glycosyltransferase involved in cell wall biosynthesis